jgi:hypothetical protein
MQKIIVYGLGMNFHKNRESIFKKYDVVALTDSSPQTRKKYCDDFNIITPEETIKIVNESDDIKVLITVIKSTLIKEIYQYLSKFIKESDIIITPRKIDSLEGLAEFKKNAIFETVLDDYYFDVDVLEELTNANFEFDPFSDNYRENVLTVHRILSGKEHSVIDEGLDQDNSIDVFSTIKGIKNNIDFLLNYGHHKDLGEIIKEVNVKPNDRVIDVGFGFGFSLLNFAKISSNVYGIDISPKFHQIVKGLLDELNLSATLLTEDFLGLDKIEGNFDIIYFHAAFHHCNDPVKLMEIL